MCWAPRGLYLELRDFKGVNVQVWGEAGVKTFCRLIIASRFVRLIS